MGAKSLCSLGSEEPIKKGAEAPFLLGSEGTLPN